MSTREVIVPLNALPAPRDTLARPVRDLRISVMDRCNFRCPYCMPRETYHEQYRFLGSQERLSFDEIVRLARLFVHLGVRKLRLTGGEPLLRANLPDLVGDLTTIPGVEDVALTTNGVLLADQIDALKSAGLGRITVSLDTLRPDRFTKLTRFDKLDAVHAGITAAHRVYDRLKIDTVVIRGVNDDELVDLVEYGKS
ncbi:MAG TPA: radical SAM protein, partial [Steroidobacteraceae bacterium]|nr:radical SAM protein [Steroidobacteraceae bacterium]